MGESYQWDFGSAASGLQFKVVFDGTSFTVTCTSGYLDLNALWFSDGDKLVEGVVTLAKSDNSLNMNGTGITWDDYYKVSSTGLGSAGVNKASFLTAGESMSFSLNTLDLPSAITSLLASDPRLLTLGVRVTSDSSLSGEGKYVDTSGTLISTVNHAPTLNTVSGGTVTDTANDDSYPDVTGTLHGSDSDGNTVSFKLAGSVAASGTGVSAGFDVQKSTAYGTFYLNVTSGAYKFVANDAAVEGLKTTQALDFVVSATDGTADSTTQTISISLNGVNDTPGLNASLTAHTYVDTSANDTFGSVTGNLTTVERDAGDSATYAINGAGVATGSFDVNGHTYQQKLVGSFGTLYLDTSGAYEYVPNDGAIEALKTNTSEGFTLKVTDGSNATDTKTLTINLTGANDTPELSASLTARTYTDTASDDTFGSATGNLSTVDRDAGDSATYAINGAGVATGSFDVNGHTYQQKLVGSFGTLYLDASGAYEYVPNDGAIEALESNTSESFTLKVTDGSNATGTATLTINLTGAEDAPVVTAVVAGYTDTAADDSFADTTGTLSVSSRDGDTSFTFALAGSSATGQLDYDLQDSSSSFGTLYLNSSTGAYKFVANDAAIEALEAGNNPSAIYHVTAAADGATSASQTITINLTGAEDAPVVTAVVAGYTDTAADDTFTDTTGTLSVSSRDGDTSFTFALAGSSATGQLDYDLQDTSSSFGTLYLNSSTGAYKFVANDAAIEALEGGNNPSAVFHVTAAADGATSASQTITINLTGAEDAPVVTAVVAGYTDTAADDSFADTTGTLSVSSRDGDTSFTFALAGSSATGQLDYDLQDTSSSFGTLYLNSSTGAYKFVANDAAIEALEGGNNPSAVFHVTAAADGATSASQTITINLTGAEDAPVVTAVVAGYTDTAADDSFADTTGTLSVSSRDGDTSFAFALDNSSASAVTGYDLQNTSSTFGTLYLNSSTGAYKFVANDAAIEALEAGNNPSAVFHVTAAADGATSASQTITINLTGAEDAPVVTAVVAGYTDTAADDTFADTTGTLSVSSRDGDTSFTFALDNSSASAVTGYDLQNTSSDYGTLYLNSTTGAYKFVANDAAIEALEGGNNPSAVFHVTAAADGATSASQTITINLTGAEDAPVVTAVVAGYTDTAADDSFADTTGTLSVSSRDGDTSFTFALAGSSATGQLDYDLKDASSSFGTLYLNSSTGAYKFVANDAAIEALEAGNNPSAVFHVTAAADGATSASQTITINLTGAEDAPVVTAVVAGYTDTAADDSFADTTGTLSVSSRDGDTSFTFALAGSSATGQVDYDLQDASSSFGTLYLNSSTGAYKFVANDAAIEALEGGNNPSAVFHVTAAADGATSASQTITINLTGAEDAPVVTAVVAGYTDTAADDSFADTTGTLSVSSRDGDTSFTFALDNSSASAVTGYDLQNTSSTFGTLYLNSSTGAYKFVANDAAIEALEGGNNPSAVFHVTAAADGATSASQTITINLAGAEDAPVVTAVVAGYTDTAADDSFADTTGTLSVSSRDGDTSFTFALAGSSATGQVDYDLQDASSNYGTLYLNSTSGAYKFVANDAAIEALESGSNPSAVFHVTAAADGATSASQTITINLTGAEDAPVVTAVVAGYTDTAADDSFADTTGTLSVSSRDGDTSFSFALAGSSASLMSGYDRQDTSSSYGTLYLNSTSGAYKFVANDGAIEALEGGAHPSAVYHVTAAADGATSASQTITINLTGAEDAPVVAPVVASYTDTSADNTFADTVGTLSVSSRDGDTSFAFALAGSSASLMSGYDRQDTSSTYGTLYLNSTSGAYKFVANDGAIEALEAGNNPSAVFHVTAAADGATSASQTITINLTGAEDAPVVTPVVASYTDTAADDIFTDTVGTLGVSSRDGDTSFTFALAGSSASGVLGYDLQNTSSGYGTLYLNSTSGAYKFVANDGAIEALQSGNNPSLVYGVTATADGVTSASQSITIGITGGNDAPRDLAMTAVSFASGNGIPSSGNTIGTLSVPTGADPDAGGSYSYSLASAKVGALGAASITTDASAQFAVSTAGVLSTTTGLAGGNIYEVTVKVSQGAGATLATYNETFSLVTGTNAGTETLPGGGYDFSSGDDVIYGRQGVDIILAGSGNDTVFGQDDNDEIYGGTGIDVLYGGKDNDTFVFSSGDTGITLATADTIGDFKSSDDTIATSLTAGNVTIANGTALSDFNAFVTAANTALANVAGNHDAYMAWNAAGSGNGWLVVDENNSGAVDAGDSLIVLVGVNAANAFATTDIA
ncbi:VCBS domain-containing protein [Pseudomonas sp. NY15181]|uniref:VCBS domain-containing protein n=1 Tax=Pseudomonas sp. NY15181 TaxID=3400349 RepID=UPI003A8AB60B